MFYCERLEQWIKDRKSPVFYDQADRFYGVSAPKSLLGKYELWKGYGLSFCPGCGNKFLLELSELRCEILEKEYGLDDPAFDEEQKKRVPKEFLTDEWWKKREL
ncbi:MAG: hypothetical protein WBQ73_00435 [Candidatus Babeliales bacterium]